MKPLNIILAALAASSLLHACEKGPAEASGNDTGPLIKLDTGNMVQTRSESPQENLVTDLNLFIFNDRGILESRMYMTAGQMHPSGNCYTVRAGLLAGGVYNIYALANAGYPLYPDTEQDVRDMKYYFTYPDEFRTGIPMSGQIIGCTAQKGQPVEIQLQRSMAKISVSIDRSRLDKDVSFYINSISIGGCPKAVTPFKTSTVTSDFDMFIKGFSRTDSQVSELNADYGWGKSGEVSVYMFENMQGDLLEDADSDSDKVLNPSDPKAKVCSYIEIRADYVSDTYYTLPGDELIYRFYLGDGPVNFDVRRNTHYHITVTPENSGLNENSWRVDQSGLSSYYPYFMKITPGTFIRGKAGESFHIRCEYYPKSADFDIGLDELEYDRQRGIYDYVLDSDGNGVTLHLKKTGSGMLYMETGSPINQSEIVTIIVE